LGATIESQVVGTLNQMRSVWDPDEEYPLYSFIRQSQAFPDVLFTKSLTERDDIILGIELKGWYLLAKEGEPSFRFAVTSSACNPQDLIVVVPWALSNVISGSPQVFQPYIESSRYVADYRNYYWEYSMETQLNREIEKPSNIFPYPRKTEKINDRPKSDKGNNFGRLARTNIMDAYISTVKTTLLSGIPAQNWLDFFKIFQENKPQEQIQQRIQQLKKKYSMNLSEDSPLGIILDQLELLLTGQV
jgi:hypothetical protein